MIPNPRDTAPLNFGQPSFRVFEWNFFPTPPTSPTSFPGSHLFLPPWSERRESEWVEGSSRGREEERPWERGCNAAWVSVINSQYSSNRFMQRCLRELWLLLALFNIQLIVRSVPGCDNWLADLLSRFHIGEFRVKFQSLSAHLHLTECTVSDSLFDFVRKPRRASPKIIFESPTKFQIQINL